MSKILNLTHSTLKAFDFFPNKQFIRYQHQNEYKTATGGAVSLAIIICFTILFLNNGLKTIRKQLITSSHYTQYDSNPTAIDLNFRDKSFMFAIFISGINLTDPTVTWFDISATQVQYSNAFTIVNSTKIPLVPCTEQHVSITESTVKDYQRYKNYGMLCPSLNSSLHLQGKRSSNIYSYLEIRINKCNSTLHNNCAPDFMIQQLQSYLKQWVVYVPVITAVINPSNSEYKTYIIQDRNYFNFTTNTYGINVKGYYQGFTVDTDQSIFPFQSHNVQKGGLVRELFTQKQFALLNQTQYVYMSFSKSPIQTIYSRSFQKIDTYLSYVGGLIGIVLIFFFIFQFYTEAAYSLSLAAKIFTYKEKEVEFERFNFFYFLAVKIIMFFKYLKCKCSWEIIDQFIHCKNQIQKQVDITFILKRIKYLQNAVSVVLQQHQYQALHLSKKEELNKAIYNRLLYQKEGDLPDIHLSYSHHKFAKEDESQINQTPSTIQVKSQDLRPQEVGNSILKNESVEMFKKQKTGKMVMHIQKLIREAQNGDPISCKVAQKIGVDLDQVKKKVRSEGLHIKIINIDESENKSND